MAVKVGFIRDGYNRTGFVKESEFHPALQFVYRPMLQHEVAQLNRKIIEAGTAQAPDGTTDKGAADAEKVACAEMAKRIINWDLKDDTGAKVEITAVNVERVEPHLAGRILSIVQGNAVSDNPAAAELADVKN